MKSKKSLWLTLLYVIAVFFPYMIPAFNSITPKLGHLPFTVWWTWLIVALFCVCLFVWSRNGVFDAYDDDVDDKDTQATSPENCEDKNF